MTERIMEHRQIHPWASELPSLAEGKGNFYYYGPNYTVDPIVITCKEEPAILLIKRSDTGDWALPGGFIDQNEDASTAGLRELAEETGLDLSGYPPPVITYQGPVDDPRATKHAWPETTALLWFIDSSMDIKAGDDATHAEWIALKNLPDKLYGSHRKLIEGALTNIKSD